MKERRAAEIAGKLNDTKRWRSHGRGLSMEVIDRDLNLLIDDFGKNTALNTEVRAYYRLLQDYMNGRGCNFAIHTRDRLLTF